MLERSFYKRDYNREAVESIKLEDVFNTVIGHIKG